jgi:ATP-dependent DNA helicase DinG
MHGGIRVSSQPPTTPEAPAPVPSSDTPWPQVADAFAADGALARLRPGFVPRPGQTEMALAVARAIAEGDALVVEAGTGVGKTYAYLVPALLSGERLLLSTATKALQDQLYQRDLPAVLDALGLPRRTALLKGRASYLCLHRLGTARQLELDETLARSLAEVEQWAQATQSGDLAELAQLDERSGIVPLVTSTRDNCLGTACAHARACHVHRARQGALAADVVVANHHLLFADMAVRESGVAELLPQVRVVVVDEAHQLSDIGVQFLGAQLGSAQLQDFARDLLRVGRQSALGLADWDAVAGALGAAVRDLRALPRASAAPGRSAWEAAPPEPVDGPAARPALDALQQVLETTAAALAHASGFVAELDRLHQRCEELLALARRFALPQEGGQVRWIDTTPDGLRLIESPLDVAQAMQSRLLGVPDAAAGTGETGPKRAWIFTSATLGDDERLSWFTEPCGLQHARVLRVVSPFDYATQAALYLPPGLPAATDDAHPAAVAEWLVPVLQRLGGRTLVLTTSLRALRAIGAGLRAGLPAQAGVEVLVQGESPKRRLMERFRAGGSGGQSGCVLVASASFWEGFDVPGDRLQLVVIDKLPFPPPGDPLARARAQRVVEQGRSAFAHYAVPEAAVALKQGAGRLIRSESDRGILVVCDQRLATMGYGKRLLRALPPMRRLADAAAFDEALAALTTAATTPSPRP